MQPTKSLRRHIFNGIKSRFSGAVVVGQLVERLLPTPEIQGSNSFICKFYLLSTVFKNELRKRK